MEENAATIRNAVPSGEFVASAAEEDAGTIALADIPMTIPEPASSGTDAPVQGSFAKILVYVGTNGEHSKATACIVRPRLDDDIECLQIAWTDRIPTGERIAWNRIGLTNAAGAVLNPKITLQQSGLADGSRVYVVMSPGALSEPTSGHSTSSNGDIDGIDFGEPSPVSEPAVSTAVTTKSKPVPPVMAQEGGCTSLHLIPTFV